METLAESDNLKNLVLITILGSLSEYAYYAISYGVPRILNEGYCSKAVTLLQSCEFDKSVLFDLGVVSLSEPLGALIAVITVDIIGRRKTFFIAEVIFLVSTTAVYFCGGYAYLMGFVSITRAAAAAVVFGGYLLMGEYFPTSVRSFVIAILTTASRCTGILGIFSAQYVYNHSPRLMLALVQVAMVLCFVCSSLLKRETMGAVIQ